MCGLTYFMGSYVWAHLLGGDVCMVCFTWWCHTCGVTYLVESEVQVDLLGGSFIWFDLLGGVV